MAAFEHSAPKEWSDEEAQMQAIKTLNDFALDRVVSNP